MKMYQHDLRPDLHIALLNAGVPIDLTVGVDSIKVIGVYATDGTTAFSRTATGNAQGVVSMEWEDGDTDTLGRLLLEVEVTWADTKKQTFRPTRSVQIVADYG